jgi:TPR repeat protein
MRDQDEIEFDEHGPHRPRPWRLILGVAIATLVAVMLVPSDPPATDPDTVAGSVAPNDTDTPPPSLLEPLALPDEPTAAGAASLASMAPAIETAPANDARALIAEHRASDSADFGTILEAARKAQADGADTDAYLLFFYAARGGDADAAFALAEQADPAQRRPDAGLFDEPDPLQAFKWYETARDAGHPLAATRLEELRRQVDARASAGDVEAQRLSLMWR